MSSLLPVTIAAGHANKTAYRAGVQVRVARRTMSPAATGRSMPPTLKTNSAVNSEVVATPTHDNQILFSTSPIKVSPPATIGMAPSTTVTA